jgi:hypothetical protein
MGGVARWWIAGLVTAAAFAVATWVAGEYALSLVMRSAADRWVVAAGLGVAVAALAAMWGQSWATRQTDVEPDATAAGERSIIAGQDISGIASTGDHTTNIQHK